MKVNINNLVSISEANQNFSKVARLVDENGAAIILKQCTSLCINRIQPIPKEQYQMMKK